ncbi:hypothetical protein QTP86_009458 [Hemibagrus guttatus]|nr:hypothetical protein QTP86_009458 [Hemibagrus guttatus]
MWLSDRLPDAAIQLAGLASGHGNRNAALCDVLLDIVVGGAVALFKRFKKRKWGKRAGARQAQTARL